MGTFTAAAVSALLFVLAVAAAGWGAVALRSRLRALTPARTRRLSLIDRIELGDRQFVALVRIDDHEILVGGAPQALSLLHTQPASEQEAPPKEPTTADFRDSLRRALGARLGLGPGGNRTSASLDSATPDRKSA